MKYIDIHCHLNLDDFNLDQKDVISRAGQSEVGIINVGVDLSSSTRAIKIAEENENIWAIIGQHPVDVSVAEFDSDKFRELASHPKVVGIGECGFDFYHKTDNTFENQKEIFEKQIAIANEIKKPLMLHVRNGLDKKQDAYDEAIEVLKKHAKVPGDVHFYAGTLEQAKKFIDLGFRLSFTGVITFVRDYDEVIKNIPLNMVMSETDAPFVTPVPYRGQRNEPVFVIEIARKIAEIRGEEERVVSEHLVDNAKKLFLN